MIDYDYDLESQKHRVASDICCQVLAELDAQFDSPSTVNLSQIQICLQSLFSDDLLFLSDLFESLFLEVEYIEVEKLREKSVYHSIMMTAIDERAFQESVA